jgi:hypothetical protein
MSRFLHIFNPLRILVRIVARILERSLQGSLEKRPQQQPFVRYLSRSETRVNAGISRWKIHLPQKTWRQKSIGVINDIYDWKATFFNPLQELTISKPGSKVYVWIPDHYQTRILKIMNSEINKISVMVVFTSKQLGRLWWYLCLTVKSISVTKDAWCVKFGPGIQKVQIPKLHFFCLSLQTNRVWWSGIWMHLLAQLLNSEDSTMFGSNWSSRILLLACLPAYAVYAKGGTDGAQQYAMYLTSLESKTSKTHKKLATSPPGDKLAPILASSCPTCYILSDIMQSCPTGI